MHTAQQIVKAVQILRAGGLVAFPTETVYGLGGDAANPQAVHKIYAAKSRPANHPLIVHIASLSDLSDWVLEIPDHAYQLAAHFWPGPLTLILQKKAHVLDVITANQDTLAIRVPRHPIAQQLLTAFGGGLAAPSANQFTHISPTHAEAVREELGDKVDLVLEGGDCELGLESTILDLTQSIPTILRPGMITAAQISAVLGTTVLDSSILDSAALPSKVKVPGMHANHYSPHKKTYRFTLEQLTRSQSTLKQFTSGQTTLDQFASEQSTLNQLALEQFTPAQLTALSKVIPPIPIFIIHSEATRDYLAARGFKYISLPNNPIAYAYVFYRTLRMYDHSSYECILIETPPNTPEWSALTDRIQKATLSSVVNHVLS